MPPKLKVPVKAPAAPAADEEAEETEEQDGEDTAPEAPEPDAKEQELARLRRENEDFQRRESDRQEAARQPAAPTITSEQLEAMSEEAREKLEEQTGMKFGTIVAGVRQKERAVEAYRRQETEAKSNVREAIDDLVDRDLQAGKLKKHIREYFDDLPVEIRADPAAVARHMKKAVTYAKGAAGVPAASGGRGRLEPTPPGPDDEPEFDPASGEEPKPGTKVTLDTGLKITIPEAPKNMVKSPERANGVLIGGTHEEPRFS